jgi:hypothetical protein
MADDLAEWIQHLSDASSHKRAKAASSLFHRGVHSVEDLFDGLGQDPEFRALTHSLEPIADPKGPPVAPRFIIGVAVKPASFERIRIANGSPLLADVPPDQDAIEFELQFENHVELDILTTKKPKGDGAIARFLSKFGEGIQQVEVYVRDVDRATEILRTRFGLQPIYPETRAGANGTRVNFFLVTTREGGKALIELVEDKTKN